MKHIVCQNAPEIAETVGQIFIDQVTQKKNSVLLLATGSSPIMTYQYIVKDYQSNHTDWSHVITFNLDEYLDLNPKFTHESYAHFMNEHLFKHINIKKENIHFPDKQKVNGVYHEIIWDKGGIDLAILGVGTNGHIAFNEPGSDLHSQTRIVELKESTRQSNAKFFGNNVDLVPTHAVTVGLEIILGAKKIVVIATGSDKAAAINHLLQADHYNKDWPITALFSHHNVLIVTDELK